MTSAPTLRQAATPFDSPPITIVPLSGNPKAESRTLSVARLVGARIAAALPGARLADPIDIATFATELTGRDHPVADAARRSLATASVVVVATPVYKASFTGLLKLFLDGYGSNGLGGVVAVPVVVSASPAHALVGEVHLRPVLVELGAVVPTRSFTVVESQLGDVEDLVENWWEHAGVALARQAGAELRR